MEYAISAYSRVYIIDVVESAVRPYVTHSRLNVREHESISELMITGQQQALNVCMQTLRAATRWLAMDRLCEGGSVPQHSACTAVSGMLTYILWGSLLLR